MVPMAIAGDGLPHRKPCRSEKSCRTEKPCGSEKPCCSEKPCRSEKPCHPTGRAARRHHLGRPTDLLGGRGVWEITSHSRRHRQTTPLVARRAVTRKGGLQISLVGGVYGKSPHTVGVVGKRRHWSRGAPSPGRAAFRPPWCEGCMGNHLTQWAS